METDTIQFIRRKPLRYEQFDFSISKAVYKSYMCIILQVLHVVDTRFRYLEEQFCLNEINSPLVLYNRLLSRPHFSHVLYFCMLSNGIYIPPHGPILLVLSLLLKNSI